MDLQTVLFISLCLVYTYAQPSYLVPDPQFQAKNGGGFRAYLPDSCGVENFEFQAQQTKESAENLWMGGNVTQPEGDHWIYEAPKLALAPGDRLRYRASVKHQGRTYRHPDSEWLVPADLVNEYATPLNNDKREHCRDRKPQRERDEMYPHQQKPNFKSPCPWVDVPRPGDSREVVLEKQLIGLQCEMSSFMDRSARLQYQLTQELTDLKKLTYESVSRMQRLESLIRSMPPSRSSYPSYPFI